MVLSALLFERRSPASLRFAAFGRPVLQCGYGMAHKIVGLQP